MRVLIGVCCVFAFLPSPVDADFIEFGPAGTYVSGGAIEFPLDTSPMIVSDATLEITFQGDLNMPEGGEGFEILLDGVLIDEFFDGIPGVVSDVLYDETYVIPQAVIAPLLADGNLILSFDAADAVDPLTFPDNGPFAGIDPGFALAVEGSLEFVGVPEPSGVLAIVGIGSMLALRRRK